MRIALDGIPLTLPRTGVGHYTFELARAIAHERPNQSIEVVAPSSQSPILVSGTDQPSVNLVFKSINVGSLGRRWWTIGLPRYIRSSTIELFHGTNYEVPLWRPCATVVTIHDFSLLSLPEMQSRRKVARARVRLPIMARAADAVIVPSQAIKNEACERLKLPATKIFAVPEAAREFFQPAPAVEIEAIKKRFGISDCFIFAVGTIEPRKNYLLLIEAFENAVRLLANPDLQLVIAGALGFESDEVIARIDKSSVRDKIVLTGYLNDVDLRALYSSCTASAYPSVYEGFGLPPLEAMACGAPVIASNIPSVAEAVGNAARLVDPRDSNSWSRSILELFVDKNVREAQVAAGFRRVAQLSWARAARETLAVYEEALARWRKESVA